MFIIHVEICSFRFCCGINWVSVMLTDRNLVLLSLFLHYAVVRVKIMLKSA